MIEIRWYDDDKTILLMVFAGAWTIQQLEQSLQQISEMLGSMMNHLGMIIELASAMAIPPIGFINSLKKMIWLHEDCDVRSIVYVASYSDSLVLWREFIQTLPIDLARYHFVDTYEEALAIIHT